MERKSLPKGAHIGCVPDFINIAFSFAGISCVEVFGNFFAVCYRNIIRKKRIKASADVVAFKIAFGFKAYAKHVCMNAGIGSGTAFDVGSFALKKNLHCVLKSFRNGNGVFLNLEAVVVCAFIRNGQKKISQSLNTSGPKMFIRITAAKPRATKTAAPKSFPESLSCFILVLPSPP